MESYTLPLVTATADPHQYLLETQQLFPASYSSSPSSPLLGSNSLAIDTDYLRLGEMLKAAFNSFQKRTGFKLSSPSSAANRRSRSMPNNIAVARRASRMQVNVLHRTISQSAHTHFQSPSPSASSEEEDALFPLDIELKELERIAELQAPLNRARLQADHDFLLKKERTYVALDRIYL
ncbi:hypothetical protein BDR26DRAFT_863824 [Obelidium mucronatum]|nr:hypothetical protein BDR26DRAFT_863824 [Obelidium mucronatum]